MTNKLKWLSLIAVAASAVGVSQACAASASFDCGKAQSPVEHAICGDAKLGDLDIKLAAAVKLALAQSGDNRAHLLDSQREWLRMRDKTCTSAVQINSCLHETYEKRIAELKAAPSICESLIGRIRPIIEAATDEVAPNGTFGFAWAQILASRPKSGITLVRSTSSYLSSSLDKKDVWVKQVTQLLRPYKMLDDKLPRLIGGGDGLVYMVPLAPSENLYVIEAPQGRRSCNFDTYVRISNGTAQIAEDIQIPDAGDDGGVCQKGRNFGTVDGVPAIIDDEQLEPSLTTTLSIRLRVAGGWTPLCGIDLDFQPRFASEDEISLDEIAGKLPTYEAGKKQCNALCAVFRKSASELVRKAQADPDKLEADALGALSQDQRKAFETLKRLNEGTVDPEQKQFGTALVVIPLLINEQLYLAQLDHPLIPGYSGIELRQWQVEFENLQDSKLNDVMSFSVGMTQGHLSSIAARPMKEDPYTPREPVDFVEPVTPPPNRSVWDSVPILGRAPLPTPRH